MRDCQCPLCAHTFDAMPYVGGTCPKCGLDYGWDCIVDDKTGDPWDFIDWDLDELRQRQTDQKSTANLEDT